MDSSVASGPRTSLPRIALWLVCAAVSAGVALVVRDALEAHLRQGDERALESAASTLRANLAVEQAALVSQVKLLRDDARIREPLATAHVDEATIKDILDDLRTSSGYALLAVLAPAGTVRAVSGPEMLKGVDLGSSAVLRRASEAGGASDVWSFPERLMVVAATPVSLGSEVVAFLLIGNMVDAKEVGELARASDAAAVLLVGDRPSNLQLLDERTQGAVPSAATLTPGRPQAVPSHPDYMAKLSELDPTRGGRVLWLMRREQHQGELALAGMLLWGPLAASLLGLGVDLLMGRRR